MSTATLFTYGPDNVDSLLSTTRSIFSKGGQELNDAIFGHVPLLRFLESKSKVTTQGGASILVSILYGKNNTIAAYSGDDIISTQGQEGITTAQAKFKNYGGTVKYDGDEIRANSGKSKIKDLAKAKVKQTLMSARDKLAIDLHASSQASKAVACLPVLVDATSSVQDIASSTNTWWQSQVTASGSMASRGLADMRDLRDDIIRQGQSGAPAPDFILTTQLLYEAYEALLEPGIRYSSRDTGDASFESLKFSSARMEFDVNCASGVLYMLSSDALEFVCDSQAQWTLGDFVEPANQDIFVAKVLWRGNLVTNNRRRLGKLTSMTA